MIPAAGRPPGRRGGGDPVDAYVRGLGRALVGARREKADMLAEVADGLTDAAEAYEAEGLERAEARRRAVADFGTVAEVAPHFQAELHRSQGRRLAVLVAVVSPAGQAASSSLWTASTPREWRLWQAQPDWLVAVSTAVDAVPLLVVPGAVALWLLLRRSARRAADPARLVAGTSALVLAMALLPTATGVVFALGGAGDVLGHMLPRMASLVMAVLYLVHLVLAVLAVRSLAALAASRRAGRLRRPAAGG
ncbi:permease prefix domain 1-containing protein [Allonocardiopsis opalescens]|uniref:Uncharacterized protein n=1 Tax=Allonocardiopsis opalescens TaxID=1144618 RepID=A0A2T0QDH8_9ACTN|nr:permease prefix domain 1-containing protein [Allonocardiopsis opalescens]PRY02006.1 hypothetical protein CLV72_101604 [Allonocardiopsis opalescens]